LLFSPVNSNTPAYLLGPLEGLNAVSYAKHLALSKHMLGTGQRLFPHSNPCHHCHSWTKLLEDENYSFSFLSVSPVKTPVPKAAR